MLIVGRDYVGGFGRRRGGRGRHYQARDEAAHGVDNQTPAEHEQQHKQQRVESGHDEVGAVGRQACQHVGGADAGEHQHGRAQNHGYGSHRYGRKQQRKALGQRQAQAVGGACGQAAQRGEQAADGCLGLCVFVAHV